MKKQLLRHVRFCIWIMIIGLALSGITAFPIETELAWFAHLDINHSSFLFIWLNKVYIAVKTSNHNYPFLAYGTDWLAFAHLMFAILFIGPLQNPVKNKWVIQFGIISAVMIFPLVFIAGSVRGIPLLWTLVDCSFGVVTLLILLPCYSWVKQLEKLGWNIL